MISYADYMAIHFQSLTD